MIILIPSISFGQDAVVVKPITRAQVLLREGQTNAQKIWAEQDRERQEWIESLPVREWTMANKKTFKGKFVEMKLGKVYVIRNDGEEFDVPLSKFSSIDQKFIRAEIAARKTPQKVKKVPVKKTEQ